MNKDSQVFSYCPATNEDCFLIRELASQVWYHTYLSVHSREQLDYMFIQMYDPVNLMKQMEERQKFYIGYQCNSPIGYFSIQQKEKDKFCLQRLYVLPEYQGSGVGKYLFTTAVSLIKEQQPSPCKLELNVNRQNKAIQFYQRMGMQIYRESDDDIGNGFVMNNCFMRMII